MHARSYLSQFSFRRVHILINILECLKGSHRLLRSVTGTE